MNAAGDSFAPAVRTALLCFVLALSTSCATATEPGTVDLAAPAGLAAQADTQLVVSVGSLLPRNSLVVVKTPSGETVGTISPFGVRAAQAGGQYALPLPKTAISAGRLRLRLEIVQAGAPPRAPIAGEIESIELKSSPASTSK